MAHLIKLPAVPRPAALELCDAYACYDQVEVLHRVNLKVTPGCVVALLGPNGAGKTTTLRVASGQLRLSSGSVFVDGRNIAEQSADGLARSGVCLVPEGRGVFPTLTVSENLRMWTYRDHTIRLSDVEEQTFSRFPLLAARRKQLAGTLSGGEQQMLSMSRALSTNPRLLLLDEISMGLAPLVVRQLYELVEQLANDGFAILVVEQFAQTALRIADRAAVMIKGQIEMEGTPTEVGGAVAEIYMRANRM
jgi:branched-chain amino acid transport system ATP-binding protein